MEGTAAAGTAPVATKYGGSTPLNLNSDFKIPGSEGASDGGGEAGKSTDDNKNPGAGNDNNDGGNAGGDAGSNKGGASAAATDDKTKITDEQLIATLKEKGIDVSNLEEIKTKMTAAAPAELTEEQKKQAAEEKDRKLLQLYMAGGGTPEQFVTMKSLLTANPTDLATGKIKSELKEAGFSDEQIAEIMNERYWLQDPEKLERLTDESEDDFKKRKEDFLKKSAFGKNKIESRGKAIIKQAETFFSGLNEAMSIQEQLIKRETDFVAKVDEMVSKIDKKVTIQLGKINEKDESPIEFEVTDEDVAEVAGILKDQAKRNQFFNKDNGLNLENVMTLMLRNKYLERGVQKGFLEGKDRTVSEFRKVFPGTSAHDIGLGGGNGSSTTSNGKVAKAGKSTPMPVKLK